VAGFSNTLEEVPLGQSPIVHAFLWTPNTPNGTAGTLHDLGSPGVTSYGYGINDRGQVTGIVQTGPGFYAFLWTPTIPNGSTGTQHAIGTRDRFSEGRAINGSGRITGSATREAGFESRALIWNSAAPVGATDRLHSIDFQSRYNVGHTWGYGINDGGRVTGAAWFIPQSNCCNEHAFVWTPNSTGNAENGTLQDLGTLGGLRSTGFAINANGLVTGEADTTELRHAFLYDGAMHDLGTLGGVVSVGQDINFHGHVTGWSLTDDHRIHAFLYTSGTGMVDLNSLIDPQSGWELQEARGINDIGQIAGTGLLNGEQRAFLLTPVPEPTSSVLFALATLSLVVTLGRCERTCALAYKALVAISILLLFVSAGPASAAMFTAGNVTQLIAAIDAANQNGEPDSIALAAGATFTLAEANHASTIGSTGLPTITTNENLTIFGNGGVIERSAASGTPAFRLFNVAAGASLSLENLTLQGGMVGTELGYGGAIYNSGNLALTDVLVQNSVAQGRNGSFGVRGAGGPGGWGLGGGIYSTGSLLLENSTLRNNQARGGSGGASFCRGSRCHLYPGGRGGWGEGGGVYVAGGTATLLGNVVTGNVAQGGAGGGGLYDGVPGHGYGGGVYITNAQVGLDELTIAQLTGNTASTSDPNILGPFEIIEGPTFLPGDYNVDGAVDAADYVVWRKDVDPQVGFNVWRANFGASLGVGNGSAIPSAEPLSANVPEPSTFALLFGSAWFALRHRRAATMPRWQLFEPSLGVRRPRKPYAIQYPQGDSNPCRRRERAVSWASRRWGLFVPENFSALRPCCKLPPYLRVCEDKETRRQGEGEIRRGGDKETPTPN
jgi:probable HAF family extracellular repeat protein